MMRHQTTLASGLAAVLLTPFAMQQDDLLTLEQALAETSRALDVLISIEEHVASGQDDASRLVLAATEEPFLEPELRDARLQAMRNEVSLLQMELDAIEMPEFAGATGRVAPIDPTTLPGLAPQIRTLSQTSARATVGLDGGLRKTTQRRSRSQPGSNAATDRGPSPEGEGYSADPLKQAQACYQAGRYTAGLELLANRTDVPSLYWQARCLADLLRLDEAIALLTQIVDLADGSFEGRRAANDLEFLRWKQEFLGKMPRGVNAQGGQR